jgi:nitrite reductase/ring-hydroxylating ferredoxin subunit
MSSRKTGRQQTKRPAQQAPAARTQRRPAQTHGPASAKKPSPRTGGSRRTLVIGVVAVVVVVAAVAWGMSNKSTNPSAATSGSAATNGQSANAAPAGSTGSGQSASVPAEEQKYIGRLLPAGYHEPTVQPVTYSGATQMTDITADATGAQLSVSLADVTANKIVAFQYSKADGSTIPLIAYVKPTGAVFVAVSYCIPCKGTRQYVDADGTLTCNSCGTKRDLSTGVGLSGACRLYPLDEVPASVSGDKLVVEKTALDQWTPQPQDRPVG